MKARIYGIKNDYFMSSANSLLLAFAGGRKWSLEASLPATQMLQHRLCDLCYYNDGIIDGPSLFLQTQLLLYVEDHRHRKVLLWPDDERP